MTAEELDAIERAANGVRFAPECGPECPFGTPGGVCTCGGYSFRVKAARAWADAMTPEVALELVAHVRDAEERAGHGCENPPESCGCPGCSARDYWRAR